jgi:primosomal protein N' (replication factor Y) (superfamily II helicase)
MSEQLATFVQVILPLSLQKLYTYRVPQEFEQQQLVGKRVAVQFGKRKIYAAIVLSVSHTPPQDYEAKFLLDVLDDEILLSPQLLKFWEWMADYYMCSMGDVMQAGLPAPLRLESTTNIKLNAECDVTQLQLSDKEYLIVEALTVNEELTIDDINEITQQKNSFNIIKSLYIKEAIVFSEELTEVYKAKTTLCIQLNDQYNDDAELEKLFIRLEKQPKQIDALLAYLHLKKDGEHIEKKTLLKKSGISESSLKTLLKNGIFVEYKTEISRLKNVDIIQETFALNDFQQQAYDEIIVHFKNKQTVLLHGITSSGKTHVYVKLIEEAIKQQQQALFLLPEIALTSQVITRMQRYFGADAVAFHSKYSANERVEIWNNIQSGKAKIIIGARSAIFLPFHHLGLIIVDEEHESSYKQYDPAPRYNARDAAMMLGAIWKCNTLLGSATPSFESYFNAESGRYGLVKMNKRFGEAQMPDVITANIAEETRTKTMKGHLTSVLYQAIDDALNHNEQVILFQNRRGYAPILECEHCHWIPKCTNCDISLTYHKYIDSLKCHYCGYVQKIPQNCHACGSHLLNLKGIGTEKIEDEINIFFPNARVSRLDLDATKTKLGHEHIIHQFENHEADILVGTQMLSKGLDFGKVSVVGVINADQLLFFPDFRANERTFQLLTQVGGRAGRKAGIGKVIIQTGAPLHHVIQDVIHHRYDLLFKQENEERKQFLYPPYFRLIKICVKHKDPKITQEAAQCLHSMLHKKLGDYLIGPESPYVSKIRNLYIKEMLIKVDRNSPYLNDMKRFVKDKINIVITQTHFKRTIIYVDVDPF